MSRKFAKQGKRARYRQDIGFTDMILNMTMRLVLILAVMLLIVINPHKTENIKPQAEMQVILEWNDGYNDDIDLWAADPNNALCYFYQRQAGFMSLDRDDRGNATDTEVVNGQVVKTDYRREVMTINKIIPGEYIFNAQFYTKSDERVPVSVKITVITYLPTYKIIYTQTVDFDTMAQEKTLARITFDQDKNVVNLTTEPFRSLFHEGGRAPQ